MGGFDSTDVCVCTFRLLFFPPDIAMVVGGGVEETMGFDFGQVEKMEEVAEEAQAMLAGSQWLPNRVGCWLKPVEG
ncbi:hypothetical protein SLA2020_254300 [Shorea laevis]